MRIACSVCAALLALASILLTAAGSARDSSRIVFGGGLCFSLAVPLALVLGMDESILLLFGLILLCLSRLVRKERKT